jgi:long-subunit fatty acid transport protein
MKIICRFTLKITFTILFFLTSLTAAFSGGFENPVIWSGEYAGMGGAAVSTVVGSQSIYFNPAGLAGTVGSEVSGNFSPTEVWFQGSLVSGNTLRSKDSFAPVVGLTGGYGITPQLAVGIGIYTSGGGKADYNPVDFGSFGLKPGNLQGDLTLTEFSVGLGYEIFPGFKFGAAWRGVLASSTLALPNIVPSNIAMSTDTSFDSLSQFVAKAYRLGILWNSIDQVWGIGADFRSNVNFDNISGSFTTTSLATGATVDTGGASLNTAFPSQFSVGVHHVFSDCMNVAFQYDFTNYNEIDALRTTTVGPVTGTTRTAIPTQWHNMSTERLGVEYTGIPTWSVRAGYSYSSAVVPASTALPVFTSTGPSNLYSLGAGKQIASNIHVDLALGYNHGSGEGPSTNPGQFADSQFAIHTGGTFAF